MVPPNSDVKKPGAFLKAPGKWLFILHPYGEALYIGAAQGRRMHLPADTKPGEPHPTTTHHSIHAHCLHCIPLLPCQIERLNSLCTYYTHLPTMSIGKLEISFRQHPNPRPRGAALIFLFSPRPFPWAAPPGDGWPSRSADSPTYSCWQWRDSPSPAPPDSSCGPGTEA